MSVGLAVVIGIAILIVASTTSEGRQQLLGAGVGILTGAVLWPGILCASIIFYDARLTEEFSGVLLGRSAVWGAIPICIFLTLMKFGINREGIFGILYSGVTGTVLTLGLLLGIPIAVAFLAICLHSQHGSNRLSVPGQTSSIGIHGWLKLLIISCFVLTPSIALSATLQPVTVSSGIIHVPAKQKITIARLDSITSITTADVDSWATAGTRALQVADSMTDVACPAIIQRNGSFAVFTSSPPYDFTHIDSADAYSALRAVPQRVKIVGQITFCNNRVLPEAADGCSDTGIIGIGTQILLASDKPIPAIVFTHEFGHNVGNRDLGCPSCLFPGAPNRLMYYQEPASGERNEVVPDECRKFQRDTE